MGFVDFLCIAGGMAALGCIFLAGFSGELARIQELELGELDGSAF